MRMQRHNNSQLGALFGLDARIALAVFSLLAVVAGAAMVMNVNESRAKGLVAELVDTGKAIEQFHADVKEDIFMVLEEPTEARAFQALYDNMVVTEADNRRGRWNGPYLRAASNFSANYGEMSLRKRSGNHQQDCDSENLCYIWLVYSEVQPDVVREANELMDGVGEAAADVSGRIQWSQQEDRKLVLYYRVSKALVWTQ